MLKNYNYLMLPSDNFRIFMFILFLIALSILITVVSWDNITHNNNIT